MESTKYIVQRLKKGIGVILRGKEASSRMDLSCVNSRTDLTRSPYLTKTVTGTVCGHTVSQRPVESHQEKSDQTVNVYGLSLIVYKFKEMSRRDITQYKAKYIVYMCKGKYKKVNFNDRF